MEHAEKQETTDHAGFSLVPVSNGKFTLFHRPKVTALAHIKSTGCTHIATLLTEKEGGLKIRDAVQKSGLISVWLPIQGADLPTKNDIESFHEKIKEVARLISEEKASILIHCSAGLHRTGMVATCLLRYLGYDKDETYNLIKQARELTAREVGEHRVALGQIFVDIFGTISSPKTSEESAALLNDYNKLIDAIMKDKKHAKELRKQATTSANTNEAQNNNN
jgi:protein tyrosine phosphatase (PTP) superfamily phosphohydrolase (DUF442 family)